MHTVVPKESILDLVIENDDIADGAVNDPKLSTTGVGGGTYTKVTVDEQGRVTHGENPTTIEGYGITDAFDANFAKQIPWLMVDIGDQSNGLDVLDASYRYLVATPNQLVLNDGGPLAPLTISLADNPVFPGTGAITLTSGTTAERPSSPQLGMLRFNTDLSAVESYDGAWDKVVLSGDKRFVDSQLIRVKKDPGEGEFGSLSAAMDSITDASAEKPYTIIIGPGIFIEPPIQFKTHVEVLGTGMESTILRAQNPSAHLIEGAQRSSLYNVTLDGVTTAGFAAVHFNDPVPTITVSFNVQSCRFGSNSIHVLCEAGYTSLENCLFGSTNPFDYGFMCKGDGKLARILLRSCTTTGAVGLTSASPKAIYYTSGTQSVLYMFSLSARYSGTTPDPNSVGVHVRDGGSVVILTTNIERWGKGLWVENVGAPPYLEITGLNLQNNVMDMVIDHPGTTGNFTGNAAKSKTTVADGVNCTIFFNDYISKGVATIGPLFIGAKQSALTDYAPMLERTGPVGVIDGGVISPHPTLSSTAVVTAGSGYLRDIITGVLKYISWNTQNLTLINNSANTIYIDTNGVAQTSAGLPNRFSNIILGGCVCSNGSPVFIARSAQRIENVSTRVEDYLRSAFSTVFNSGSQVSEGTTPFHLNVTGGIYWYGTVQFNPSGGTDVTLLNFSPNGSFTPSKAVSNTTRGDLATHSLVPITAGKFVKHALYLFEDGADEMYAVIAGQTEFDTLADAVNGPLPLPPPFFVAPVVLIASIIVQEGATSITAIHDERPRLGFTASATSSSSDHGNLLGLADDDHPQYLLTNGMRALTGPLDMGGYQIINVGNVDGIDVNAHGSRHAPQGPDPIPTAAPITPLTSTTTNSAGIANSLARSDHTHAITGFQPYSDELTALSNLTTHGILVHGHDATGEHVWYQRTIVPSAADEIIVTYGDGVGGNPKIGLGLVGTPGTYTVITTDEHGRVVSGTNTMPWSALTGTPTTLAGYGITDAQFKDNILTTLSDLSGTGIFAITGDGQATTRTITGPTTGILVTNGDGVAGDPTISLRNDLASLEGLSTTGFAVRTGSDSWATRTITTPNDGLVTTAGSGVSGNVVISLEKDLAAVEGLTTFGIAVRTAADTWATRTLQGTAGNIVVTSAAGTTADPVINLATVGAPGTYRSVTTDAYGRVTAGTNPTSLAGYGITDAVSSTLLGVANGVATLDGTGKLPQNQIPALAISDTFIVGSAAAMTALTAETGDVAVRTDLNKSFILRAMPASTASNWQELLTPTDAVLSVNGQTGAVNINTGVMSIGAVAPVAGLTISGSPITTTGTLTFSLANDLAAVEGLNTTGIAVRTGTDTWTTRSLAIGGGLTITNPDGLAGNPTITLPTVGTAGSYKAVTTDAYGRVTAGSNPTTLAGYGITDAQPLDADLTALASTVTTGLYTITGAGTSATRSLAIGSNKLVLTNANGVAGNPTLDILEYNLWINNISGTLFTSKGGTGMSTIGAANTLLGVTTDGTALEYKTLNGTANQITVTQAAGSSTVALATNPVVPGTGGMVVPAGTTAQRVTAPGVIRLNTTSTSFEAYDGSNWKPLSSPNTLVQFFRGTVAPTSGTTIIPYGNTVPTSTQGTLLWSQTMTPLDTGSYVEIQFSGIADISATSAYVMLTLFRGNTFIGMSVLASGKQGADFTNTLNINIVDIPATTSPITYSVRVGASTGTWYFGRGQVATFGNAALSHWSIKEYS